MITSPFSKKQLEEAEAILNNGWVYEISERCFVVKSYSKREKKLNRYKVSLISGKPLMEQWCCSCIHASKRRAGTKYCKHVLAVMMHKIKKGIVDKSWINAIYGDENGV